MKKIVTFFFLIFTFENISFSQYIINGSAIQNSCNCYTLTVAQNNLGGSVWQANKINLSNSFDFTFNVYLGCADATGADGIVFILQPLSTSLGISGGGMGFGGVSPSIGIALDTWQNTDYNDPVFDHVSIQSNGNSVHGADLAGPVQTSAINVNIEDCQWHLFRVSWNSTTHWLRAYFDDSLRVEAQVNLVTSIFNNDPWVYWGFSGATGGANNLQQFCTALIPNFTTSIANNVTCLGSPVLFTDSSISFTTIQSFYWDFGDGIFSTVQNPPPHFYATPGNYIVKHVFTGMDGCVSDTIFRTVTIGAIPIANFTVFDTCSGKPARITEQSSCSFGNITEWSWFLDGAPFSNLQQPNLPILPVGTHQLKLFVKSQYGCSSDTITRSFLIKSRPVINFNINNTGCSNQLQNFSANQTDNLTTVQQWNWNFGDGGISVLQNPTYTYTTSGNFIVQLFAMATNGCSSDTLQQPIAIGATPAAAFSVADGCEGVQPNFVNNSSIASGSITQWNWFLNGLPFSTNPIPNLATLPPGNYLLQLIIGSNTGCISDTAFDNFVIKNKPVISSTIPVGGCTQSQLFFSATQTDVATTITQWNWNFGDNQSSTLQNLNHSYTTNGNFTIQVWAVASNGCNSDTTVRLIPINRAIAFAGNDTLVNANSHFQLKGSGGGLYSWAPTTGLNNPTFANPTAILQNDIVYVLTVNVTGCVAMDTVNITVFKGSAIYVPTGFTPNNDNLNDILRPRYVGIKQLSFFSIYNRWGQRIFSTNNMADGWDGTIKGIKQPSGTYVWMLKAEDFTGKIYELKGSTTIIR